MNSEINSTVRERIHEHFGDLTPAERRVAHVILETYPMLALRSAAVIASEAGTSPATVVRFATKLGYDGLPEVQAMTRREIDTAANLPQVVYRPLPKGKSPSVAAAQAALSLITEGLTHLDQEQVDDAASMILDARRVWIFGGRLSYGVALTLNSHLHLLRPEVHLLAPWPAPIADQITHAGRRDLAIVFDFRRYEPAAQLITSHLAGARGRSIVVTDQYMSPAAQHAAITFVTPIEGDSVTVSTAGAMALADVIASTAANRSDHPVIKRLAKAQAARNNASGGVAHDEST